MRRLRTKFGRGTPSWVRSTDKRVRMQLLRDELQDLSNMSQADMAHMNEKTLKYYVTKFRAVKKLRAKK